MHIDCKQSFLISWRFCVVKIAVRAERCQRLSLCLVSWCEESKRFCIKAQRMRSTACANSIVSEYFDLTEPKWNESCDQWRWVIVPSVDDDDDDAAGLLLTRHVLYIWLSVVRVICKYSQRCVRTHEAHGFSPTSPHTQASNTQLNARREWEAKDCTQWDSVYTVALSKYTQNKLE